MIGHSCVTGFRGMCGSVSYTFKMIMEEFRIVPIFFFDTFALYSSEYGLVEYRSLIALPYYGA